MATDLTRGLVAELVLDQRLELFLLGRQGDVLLAERQSLVARTLAQVRWLHHRNVVARLVRIEEVGQRVFFLVFRGFAGHVAPVVVVSLRARLVVE